MDKVSGKPHYLPPCTALIQSAPHSPYSFQCSPIPLISRTESTNYILFFRRPQQKRSHTLRYVLKDRATNTPLFVVLFTLYLKEDVDEDGNVKDGVEGGKPHYLMDEEQKKLHEEKKNNGVGGVEKETEPQRKEDQIRNLGQNLNGNKNLPDTSEDDLD
jgi:hypothetical protein